MEISKIIAKGNQFAQNMKTRPWIWSFLLCYTAYVIYGVLFPWVGWRIPRYDLFTTLSVPLQWSLSYPDIFQNILLYFPLGILFQCCFNKTKFLVTMCFGITLAFSTSFSLESLQSLLPQRVPSWLDVGMNCLGMLLGIVVMWLIGRCSHIKLIVNMVMNRLFKINLVTPIGFLIAVTGLIWQWWPLIPTFEIIHIKNSLSPLILSLALGFIQTEIIYKYIILMVGTFLLFHPLMHWPHVLWMALGYTFLALVGKLFIISQYLFLEHLIAWTVVSSAAIILSLVVFILMKLNILNFIYRRFFAR